MSLASHALLQIIAMNIRYYASLNDIAIAHLADQAGVGRTTIWRLLDANATGNRSDPRTSTLVDIAGVLKVPVTDLMTPPMVREFNIRFVHAMSSSPDDVAGPYSGVLRTVDEARNALFAARPALRTTRWSRGADSQARAQDGGFVFFPAAGPWR